MAVSYQTSDSACLSDAVGAEILSHLLPGKKERVGSCTSTVSGMNLCPGGLRICTQTTSWVLCLQIYAYHCGYQQLELMEGKL